METITFLLNHRLTYCFTVDLENIVLKCKFRVRIEQLCVSDEWIETLTV